jgi:hypothetical protein
MDNLDFLDGPEPAETAAAPEQPQAPTEPEPSTTEGQPRGPDGKFAPKAEAAPAPPTDPAPTQAPAITPEAPTAAEPVKPPEGFVPVGVVQAMREELNALKRQPQQPAQPAPDPYEDFEAYQAWQESQVTAERAEWSRQLAEARHGPEIVTQAQQWAAERFATDPVFAQQALSQRDPYGFAIEAWKRDQVLTKLSDPGLIDRFLAFAGGQAAPQAPVAAVAAPHQPPTPPRSLASAPSAGGDKPGAIPVHEGAAFDSVFGN